MKIVISGVPGSGKSTVAKLIAQKLKLPHYSMGDMQRAVARAKGVTILELMKLEERDLSIDRMIDTEQKKLAKKKNFVLDSRLGAYFIPNAAVRVFLKGDKRVLAQRIFSAERKDEHFKDVADAQRQIAAREQSNMQRYQKLYGVDYQSPKWYNLILDTTDHQPEQVAEEIMAFARKVVPRQ